MDSKNIVMYHVLLFAVTAGKSEASVPLHRGRSRMPQDRGPAAPTLVSMQPTWLMDASYIQHTLHEYAHTEMKPQKDCGKANAEMFSTLQLMRAAVMVTPYLLWHRQDGL